MNGAFRYISLGLGSLGLVYAVIYLASGGPRTRVRQTRAREAKHAGAVAGKVELRPLDPRVPTTKLSRELKRKVLGLYNSLDGGLIQDEGQTHAEHNQVHSRAELILNHLGLLVELRDVNAPLLGDAEMADYRGVIAWFRRSRVKRPQKYLAWLRHQIKRGRKVVLLDGVGAARDEGGRPTPPAAIERFFAAFGFAHGGRHTTDSERIELVLKRRPAEFERKLPLRLRYYEKLRLVDRTGVSYLRARRNDLPDSESDLVAVTRHGGYVAPTYATAETRFGRNYITQWHVNPFIFFARALGLDDGAPRLDFTTLNGMRLYYAHVDGDGLPSITWINRRSMCADFAREQILDRYDLPTTVSFVVAGVEPPPGGRGTKRRVAVARRIAAKENVELGVHGFAHPMNWRAYDKAHTSWQVPGYKMSAEKEIAYAARYVNSVIAPPGKRVRVMLWTGWCNPAEDQLAIAYREGLYNLNGGDPRFDASFPSYAHLVPPMHRVGKHVQYFTSGPNDYILTEEWQPPYHRWANVISTFEHSGYPRRITPMNVYYHFYIVERPAALEAMKKVMRFVIDSQPAPVFVSQYVDVVRDFATARIGHLPDGGWRIVNSSYLRTVRFDSGQRHVDLKRSRGVVGYQYNARLGALYVHLDEGFDHRIYLGNTAKDIPHVVRASAYLRQAKLGKREAKLLLAGIGRKYLTLGGMVKSATYAVVASNRKGKVLRARVRSDAAGRLSFEADINGDRIGVRFALQSGAKR